MRNLRNVDADDAPIAPGPETRSTTTVTLRYLAFGIDHDYTVALLKQNNLSQFRPMQATVKTVTEQISKIKLEHY